MHQWLDRYAPLPLDDFDHTSGRHVITATVQEPIPDDWGPLIGDVLHNLRSALDHLAHALAVENVGTPLPKEIGASVEFPIFDGEVNFHRHGRPKIVGLSSEAQTAIEALQPYRRYPDPHIDPLWLLYQLSNIDKHRRPTVTAFYLDPNVSGSPGALDIEIAAPAAVKSGETFVLGSYGQRSAEEQPDVRFGFVYDIAFQEALAWNPPWVKEILYAIWSYIGTTVVPTLEPFLLRTRSSSG
jgi:hypothetical protein